MHTARSPACFLSLVPSAYSRSPLAAYDSLTVVPVMDHSAVNDYPAADLEKGKLGKSGEILDITSTSNSTENSHRPPPSITPVPTTLARWNAKIESLAGLEARGIARVLPEERQRPSVRGYLQMAILWFSANITANNLAVGLLGPLLFELGFVDSVMCAVFGSLVGSLPTAYMSIWGAQSGNRTMVRYPFNHLHSKARYGLGLDL